MITVNSDPPIGLFGRKKIYTAETAITADNVVSVINDALMEHSQNREQIDYLYRYYRGITPVLQRKKEIRAEINNKISVNRASEIVNFKSSYLLAQPCTYICRKEGDDMTGKVNRLNEYMYAADKDSQDRELVEWMHICGVGYRFIRETDDEDAPFEICTLDPRKTFVVRNNGAGEHVLLGVTYTYDKDEKIIYDAYADGVHYRIKDNAILNTTFLSEAAVPGDFLKVKGIPIIEYPANYPRMGAFENVLPLLDAMNTVTSNRIDGIEQFIQSLMVFTNCELDEEDSVANIREKGAVFLKSTSDVKASIDILSEQLSQGDTQTVVDDMYTTVLEICGMPHSNSGAGASGNVGATIYSDNWHQADARAQDTEDMIRMADKVFIKLALQMLPDDLDIKFTDVKLKFERHAMDNLLIKTQAAMNMKSLGYAPEIVFARTGLSGDPVNDVIKSQKYIDMAWGLTDFDIVDDEEASGRREYLTENRWGHKWGEKESTLDATYNQTKATAAGDD